MRSIQAIPYVPGRARGILRFGDSAAKPGFLAVVSRDDLEDLKGRPAAVIAVETAPLSHAMIRLFSTAIPTVRVSAEQAASLREGVEAVVDGGRGFICDPLMLSVEDRAVPYPPKAGAPVTTMDGVAVGLSASISGPDGAARALACGALAIGLVRSEYLVPENGGAPDAAFLEQIFTHLFLAAGSLAVRVRLLDLAADKRPVWLPETSIPPTALGLHGARLFGAGAVREVMLAQVDAMARIPSTRRLSLLVPSINDAEEFYSLRGLLAERLPESVPIGAMAETPAAVLALPELLARADFAAVGCNDLMQYLFAADRDLAAVADLLDPYTPALYRFLRAAASMVQDRLGRVQLCGLLTQFPGVLPLLLGLGYRMFAVEPLLIPWLAQTVRSTRVVEAAQLADTVCRAPDSDSVRRLLGLPTDCGWGPGAVTV